MELTCVLHSADVCTVAIKNIKNMHTDSANRTVDILYFNDKVQVLKFKILNKL